jgi:hypothetical protein
MHSLESYDENQTVHFLNLANKIWKHLEIWAVWSSFNDVYVSLSVVSLMVESIFAYSLVKKYDIWVALIGKLGKQKCKNERG